MFWGLVSLIFVFTWDNDHRLPHHPPEASCVAAEVSELAEHPTQGLEHGQYPWFSSSLCVEHLDSPVSSACIFPVPTGGPTLCLGTYLSLSQETVFVDFVIQQTQSSFSHSTNTMTASAAGKGETAGRGSRSPANTVLETHRAEF